MKTTFAIFATLLVSASAFVPSGKTSVESELILCYIYLFLEQILRMRVGFGYHEVKSYVHILKKYLLGTIPMQVEDILPS